MIITQYPGRLGNVLFQYCFGRILATKMRWNLKSQPIPGFKNALPVRNTWWPTLTAKKEILMGQKVDLDAIVQNKKPRKIILTGHFQQYEYYKKYKEEIKTDWLYIPDSCDFGENEITIHIRSGDLWAKNRPDPPNEGQRPLPFSFYHQILTERKWSAVHIVTEDREDLMAKKLADTFGAQIHHNSVFEDFSLVKSSKNIVLSVSTFAWWAGWLSNAKRVYFPMCGFWHPHFVAGDNTNNDIALMVDDEDRYLYRELNKSGKWKGTEEDQAALLNS